MNRGASLVVATLLAAAFLGGCSTASPSQSGMTYVRYQFNCCEASDIKQTWHPGSTVQLHWMVKDAGQTSISKPAPITLTATLNGAYGNVVRLKADAVQGRAGAAGTVAAPSIFTDDRTPVPPVSTFALPPDLPPGYYNLTLKVDFGGGNSWSTGSVVVVGP